MLHADRNVSGTLLPASTPGARGGALDLRYVSTVRPTMRSSSTPPRTFPGTGLATGTVDVARAAETSPFSVVAHRGRQLLATTSRLSIERMRPPRQRDVRGRLGDHPGHRSDRSACPHSTRNSGPGRDASSWNKFIVVVTLEADDDPDRGDVDRPRRLPRDVQERNDAHDGRVTAHSSRKTALRTGTATDRSFLWLRLAHEPSTHRGLRRRSSRRGDRDPLPGPARHARRPRRHVDGGRMAHGADGSEHADAARARGTRSPIVGPWMPGMGMEAAMLPEARPSEAGRELGDRDTLDISVSRWYGAPSRATR